MEFLEGMSLIIIVTTDRVDRLRRPATTTITTITSATALSLPPSSFLPPASPRCFFFVSPDDFSKFATKMPDHIGTLGRGNDLPIIFSTIFQSFSAVTPPVPSAPLPSTSSPLVSASATASPDPVSRLRIRSQLGWDSIHFESADRSRSEPSRSCVAEECS